MTSSTRSWRPAIPESIEVFADVLCPFTHVGLRRLTAQRDAVGSTTTLRVRAWPLELVNGEPPSAELVSEEIDALRASVAPDLFVGFDARAWPATSIPALALAAVAYERGAEVGEQVSLALRNVLFEQGRDVSDAAVLSDIAAAHDVELPDERERVRVVDDWEEGRARGVEGSPHFFVDGRGYFCPTLEITHVGDRLEVKLDPSRFEDFLAVAFTDAPPADRE